MARAQRLIYQGKEGDRRGDYFVGVPARDLEEGDIALLSDEQYADITGKHPTQGPLYVPESSEGLKPARAKGEDK
jgi:hypothetical protein